MLKKRNGVLVAIPGIPSLVQRLSRDETLTWPTLMLPAGLSPSEVVFFIAKNAGLHQTRVAHVVIADVFLQSEGLIARDMNAVKFGLVGLAADIGAEVHAVSAASLRLLCHRASVDVADTAAMMLTLSNKLLHSAMPMGERIDIKHRHALGAAVGETSAIDLHTSMYGPMVVTELSARDTGRLAVAKSAHTLRARLSNGPSRAAR